MKINPLDAHDRLEHLTKQEFDIGTCCQDLINQQPFGEHPFYIFFHTRTHEDGVSKRLIPSPWIWKPRAQTNSMLFKGYPGSDILKIIWILPVRELWPQYGPDKLFSNKTIQDSILHFEKNKSLLERPEDDDPTPEMAQEIALYWQPQLFIRETLPDDKKPVWDRRMAELKRGRFKPSF